MNRNFEAALHCVFQTLWRLDSFVPLTSNKWEKKKSEDPWSFLFVGEKQKKGGVPGQILKTMEEFPYT